MATVYISKDGDMVDAICAEYYGRDKGGVVEAVFEANPGLADHGDVLPEGVTIALPDIADPSTSKILSLWS